jgi:hypothetical protein
VSDQSVRLYALLDDLEHGRISAADACAQVRGMTWARRNGKTAFQARLADALNEQDEPAPAGSFADVAHAYHAGRLSFSQYEQLQQAYDETLHH